jgi:hypothetical protein
VRQGFGEVFPPLPSELWDRHGGLDPVWIGSKPESAIQPKTRGKQWRRRELNPGPKITHSRLYVRSRHFESRRDSPAGGLFPELVTCLVSPPAR